MNKRGIELSFNWIFSIVVGAVILFLAIYGVSKLISSGQKEQVAISSQELGNLLHPLETSIESGSRPENISFSGKARIYNTCKATGQFGTQEISLVEKSGIGEEWPEPQNPKKMSTKYIFSEKMMEGKNFYSFIKPIQLPFKIGDMIVLWNSRYCFVNPSSEIEEEVESMGLNSRGIQVTSSISSCNKESVVVCFSTFDSKCKIFVDFANNRVSKEGKNLDFYGPLVYGAIFSEPGIYECQISRLLKRGAFLARVYSEKSNLIATSSQGCSSNLQSDLNLYESISIKGEPKDLPAIVNLAQNLEYQNQMLSCNLWEER